MIAEWIFIPVILQLLLVMILYGLLNQRKKQAVVNREVDEQRRALYSDAWPHYVLQVNNAIRNQFEIPVLFYVVCLLLFALDATNLFSLVIAAAFVLTRYGHAYVHVGSNYVPKRKRFFVAGTVLLLTLLLYVMAVLACLLLDLPTG